MAPLQVVLYANISDVNRRVRTGGNYGGNTPLDGMLTQQGDAYIRLRVPSATMVDALRSCERPSSFRLHKSAAQSGEDVKAE